MAATTYQSVPTTSLLKEKAVYNLTFADMLAFTAGGTDFELYYDVPSGGYDQVALALGRCEIKLQAENRALVWSFYAAQTARDVSGHVLVKNQRLPATKIGHYKLTPTQMALAQRQKVNGQRIYLGVLRVGYTSAVDVAGPPNAADVAVTLMMTMQVRVRGRHVARVDNCFSVVHLPQGFAYDDMSLAVFNKAVTMDGVFIGTAGAPTAGVPIFGAAVLKGTALACLQTSDPSATYGGLTYVDFLQVNQGGFFKLDQPVVLAMYDSTGAVQTTTSNFNCVYVGKDSTNASQAFLFTFDQKNKGVRGGTVTVSGTAAGDMQVSLTRMKMVLPEALGQWTLASIGEGYEAVYDIHREAAKKKKGKKGGAGEGDGSATYKYMKVAPPTMLSKRVSCNHFFPQSANKMAAGLFSGTISPWRGGPAVAFRKPSGYEAQVLNTVSEVY
jgi:hypothetical protein